MRQWPAEHFAALIDLLAERDQVNAVLIGGADEAELAEDVLAAVVNRQAVVSLVGRTSLRHLPGLLAACVLYVGNNSGPKHIAAALGVPTIGIHSGVVDAIEWGPVGKRAVALRRNMACSPCYLARAEDCPRALACLRGLEPTLVHHSAEMLLARPVPVMSRFSGPTPAPVEPISALGEMAPGDVNELPVAEDVQPGLSEVVVGQRGERVAEDLPAAPAEERRLPSVRSKGRSRRRQASGVNA
jgi:hypothetical protein